MAMGKRKLADLETRMRSVVHVDGFAERERHQRLIWRYRAELSYKQFFTLLVLSHELCPETENSAYYDWELPF